MNVYLTQKKDFADIIKDKDLEMGRFPLILQLGPTYSHESLREPFLVEVHQGDVTMKNHQRDAASLALTVEAVGGP